MIKPVLYDCQIKSGYAHRLEGQKDNVARVKSLVSGGPAEQAGVIEVNVPLLESNVRIIFSAFCLLEIDNNIKFLIR